MSTLSSLWKPVTAFVLVSAAALAITGMRVERDVLPLTTLVRESGNSFGPVPSDANVAWLSTNPAAQFVVNSAHGYSPFRSTSEGLALIASGTGDPLVATATVESAFLYSQGSAAHEVVPDPPADKLEWFVSVVDRARAADPGNGWFDLQAGTKLLDAGIEEVKPAKEGKPKAAPRILDEARFRAGLARLDAAAAAPFIDSRHVDRMLLRARLVPAGGMDAVSDLVGTWASTLLPEIRFLRTSLIVRLLPWLETSAPADEALKRSEQVASLMKKVQQNSKVLIEWLVARSVEKESLATLSRLHAAAGRAAESRELAGRAGRIGRWGDARTTGTWERNAGSLDLFLVPAPAMAEFDTEPGRRLDWAVFEEAVFASLVAVLFLWGLAGAVRAFFARRAEPAEAVPATARPWTLRDLAAVSLPGALLPALFFVVFNRTHPSREFGAHAAGGTFIVQLLTLLPAVVLLLSWLLRRSLAGTSGAPAPRRLPAVLLALAVSAAGIAFFWFNAPPSDRNGLLFVLPVISGAAILVATASAVAGLRRDPAGPAVGRAQIACALASIALVTLAHLVIVQPHADAAIGRYRSSVLEPWMQNEVQRVVLSLNARQGEAGEEAK